jgi:hypothetical protein
MQVYRCRCTDLLDYTYAFECFETFLFSGNSTVQIDACEVHLSRTNCASILKIFFECVLVHQKTRVKIAIWLAFDEPSPRENARMACRSSRIEVKLRLGLSMVIRVCVKRVSVFKARPPSPLDAPLSLENRLNCSLVCVWRTFSVPNACHSGEHLFFG